MDYPQRVRVLLSELEADQKSQVHTWAAKTAEVIAGGGIVYVFGSGHSFMLVEEAFHRAGGLVPIYPLFLSTLTPQTPPSVSGKLERLSGVASILWKRAKATSKDMLVVVSNSGANPVPTEMAEHAENDGVFTVALTSRRHSAAAVSRHPQGKKLMDVASLVVDNQVPPGDALVDIHGGVMAGTASTLANSFLWNWMVTLCAEKLAQDMKTIPIYRSANLPGGDQANESLEKIYSSRIPML